VEDVQICNFEDVDLKNATVIAGFPSIGLVSTIAANYLIDAINLKQIGCVTSSQFPALSVVHTGEPLSPVRIYAGTQPGGKKIVQKVEDLFGAMGKNVEDTKEVLKQYGNMSSATVLYVLERFMDRNPSKGDIGLMLSFGPGFSAQRILLKW